jgi:protein O-mannosyl-transferase
MSSTSPPSTGPTNLPASDQADAPAPSFVLSLPDDPAASNDWYLWAGVLILLVFVCFMPAISGSLIWDDDHHVGLMSALGSVSGLISIWTVKGATPQYYPLTFTSYWIEHRIWGDNLLLYHLDNFLIHSLSAILVWRLLKRLAVPGAWVAAAIWAIHPLQTESVCWISERKNVLSGFLFFSSIWFYLEYAGLTPKPAQPNRPGLSTDRTTFLLGNRGLAYAIGLLLFILALTAKTVACAMPAVMLIVLWWKGRSLFSRKTWLPLIPFFAAGLAMSAVTVYLETAAGGKVEARGPDWALSPIERLLIAGRGFWFYIFKLFWPSQLTFSYPRLVPSVDAIGAPWVLLHWMFVLATVVLIIFLWSVRDRLGRGPLAAVLFYGVTLFPALGFINIYPMRYSFVADHFQYYSGLGLIALIVGGCAHLTRQRRRASSIQVTFAAIPLAILGFLSHSQSFIYQSPLALWRDTLAKNPDSWMAADNLGIVLIEQGEDEEQTAALARSQGQSDIADDESQASKDDYADAEKVLLRALQLRPQNYLTNNSLGLLYRQMGKWDLAEQQWRLAVDVDRQDDPAHELTAPYVNYATVLMHNHPGMDVRPWLKMALDLAGQPRVKDTDIGVAYMTLGDYWTTRSIADLKANDLASQVADVNAAIAAYTQGIDAIPDNVNGHLSLARAWQSLGELDQAQGNLAKSAGKLDEAAADENQSLNTDDSRAMANFKWVADHTPAGRNALALLGMGELIIRDTRARDVQSDSIQDMLLGMQFFKDALSINPSLTAAAQNLKTVSNMLFRAGHEDRAHPDTWTLLQNRLMSLQSAAANYLAAPTSSTALQDLTQSITATHQAAESTRWPLLRDHPLRPQLVDLHDAITTWQLTGPSPASAKAIELATQHLLDNWQNHDPKRDNLSDAIWAALSFEGAVTADPTSADAWHALRQTADILADDEASEPSPATKHNLDQALTVLQNTQAATQPTTVSQ